MKIVQFQCNNGETIRIGVLCGDKVIDISANDPLVPKGLVELLQNEDALSIIRRKIAKPETVHQLSDIKLLPPITKPDKIIGIGMNYKEHCAELGVPHPKEPFVFSKYSSNIIGPNDKIEKPKVSDCLDWEVELAVVIGKKGKHIKKENAFDHVLGYTVAQDLTVRDWVDKSLLLGKNMDTMCPLGPCIVTKDEIGDPHNLYLKSWVNGVLKQNGNTKELIHRIDALISYLSGIMTLYPGDVILTGTPSGVGFSRNPPEFLKPGDLLKSEVEHIGIIENRVILK